MGTNCAPLLRDIFLYSYESEFIQRHEIYMKKEITRRDLQLDIQVYILTTYSQ